MSSSTYRLPSHVSPSYYDVHLDARLAREEFSGKVTIAIDIHEATNTIDLHAKDLTISRVELLMNGHPQSVHVMPDPDNERVVLHLSQECPPGEALLALSFSGKVSQMLKGLYLAQNRPEQVLCTQCEATYARAIFPCFDEPVFKARFAFEITTTPDVIVLANGALISVTDHNTSKTWKFAPTKVMSSYLVALVIGDIASSTEQTIHGIPLRVWAMRGKEQLGAFALEYTSRLLPWYEKYFGVPYHFNKYDQVAVPGFSAGAMENSGLVLFRQDLLIMSRENSSWGQEKAIARVVAHEFAHMWFGNLVTMQWWDDLWLNEAFAEWISTRAISELSPDYRIWDDFEGSQNYALNADSIENTHPIYSPVNTPAQAEELFDAITYLKGCSILRMLENFLDTETFCTGLRTYMLEFAEHNARGKDLWRHLQAASKQPVAQIMESWIMQGGHPCLTITLESSNGEQHLHFKQKRFFANPQVPRDNRQIWQVPMVIRYADDAGVSEIRYVLSDTEGILTLPVKGELHWCYPNANQIGFYRQDLAGNLLDKILAHLDQLTAPEQMGLLGSQWALARNGHQSIKQFLEVLSALAVQSDNYNALFEIVEHLRTVEQMIEEPGNDLALGQFRQWIKLLFKDRLKALGFEPHPGEPIEVSQQRVSVIKAMTILAHDGEAVAQVQALAERESENPLNVDPNLAAIIVAVNAQFGNDETFKKHVNIYNSRKAAGAPPQTVTRYLYSFSSFRSPELVKQTLNLFDEGIAPTEGLGPVLGQMLSARHAQLIAWEYLKNNWATIKEIGMGSSELIKTAGQLPYFMRGDLVAFCEANVKDVADMSYAQALESMDLLHEFKTRTKNEFTAWLNNLDVMMTKE